MSSKNNVIKNAVNYPDINLYSITFEKPLLNNTDHTYESSIVYKNKGSTSSSNLVVLTPKMKVLTSDSSNSVIEFEFIDDHPKFYDIMCALDNCIIDGIHRNSLKMFDKQFKLDIVEAMYQKMILLPLSLEANPRMILPVDTVHVSDDDLKSIKDGSRVACTLKFDRIKFYKNRFVTHATIIKINTVSAKQDTESSESESNSGSEYDSETSFSENLPTGESRTGSESSESYDNLVDTGIIVDPSSDDLDDRDTKSSDSSVKSLQIHNSGSIRVGKK